MRQITCTYCSTRNYTYRATCFVCGAQLPHIAHVEIIERQSQDAAQLMSWREWLEQERKRRHENQPA